MSVLNEDRVMFKDMSPEDRAAIVEAKLEGKVEIWVNEVKLWELANDGGLSFHYIYRIRPPKKLEIPWHVIRKEYKWAALDDDGDIYVYTDKPGTSNSSWCPDSGAFCRINALMGVDATDIDWKESLTERPADK